MERGWDERDWAGVELGRFVDRRLEEMVGFFGTLWSW